MSQEHVELAHRGYDAFNRRDLGAFLALMDADVEGIGLLAPVEGGYHGHDGMRRWWENMLDSLPDFTMEVVAVRDLGDLTVVALRLRGHGAASNTPVEQRVWHVGEWRDKKVVWWRAFETEAEALEAVGLRE